MSQQIDLNDLEKQLKRARRKYWHAFFTFHYDDWRSFAATIKKLRFDITYWKRTISKLHPLSDADFT